MQNRIPNSRVRRRLFSEDIMDQAKIENLANILQEAELKEREDNSSRWNFDFSNEMALEGDYIWFKRGGAIDKWIGMKPAAVEEATPKIGINVDMPVPLVRKRRRVPDEATKDEVKRKINFE